MAEVPQDLQDLIDNLSEDDLTLTPQQEAALLELEHTMDAPPSGSIRDRVWKVGREMLLDPDATAVERFLAGFTEGWRSTAREAGGPSLSAAIGGPFAGVARGMVESGAASPETVKNILDTIGALTPTMIDPATRFVTPAIKQLVSHLRKSGVAAPITAPITRKALPLPRTPTTTEILPTPSVTPKGQIALDLSPGARREIVHYPDESWALPRETSLGTRLPAGHDPLARGAEMLAAHKKAAGTPLPTAAEAAVRRWKSTPLAKDPKETIHNVINEGLGFESAESAITDPAWIAEHGRPLPVTGEVGLDISSRVPSTEGAGLVYPPTEFRSIPQTRFSTELPTSLEAAQARAVHKPAPSVRKQAIVDARGNTLGYVLKEGDSITFEPVKPEALKTAMLRPLEEPTPATPLKGAGHGGPPSGIGNPGPIVDPDVPPFQPPAATYWQRLTNFWRKKRDKLPAELQLVKQNPNSWALPLNAQLGEKLSVFMQDFFHSPIFTGLLKYSPDDFVRAESKAIKTWKAGGSTQESLNQAINEAPKGIADYWRYRQTRFEAERQARVHLGLDQFHETPGPYIPRIVEEQAEHIFRVRVPGRGSALGNDLAQSLQSFQNTRTFESMADGLTGGLRYVDPKQAIIMREWAGAKVVHTAELMKALEEKGVIFRTKEGALAKLAEIKQSTKFQGQKTSTLEGLPGHQQLWRTPTEAEALFLQQNLSGRMDIGYFSSLISYGNMLFRNPNLVNPLPHVSKNMFYKYLLARGGLRHFASDVIEFHKGTAPLLKQFNELMPFGTIGETAEGLVAEQLRLLRGGMVNKALGTLRALNRPSSRFIFTYADPALRYSLWKTYLRRGMNPVEAATHTWIDLIRYGTRSSYVDTLKAIPMNFFVPWRIGTVTSLIKQFKTRPLRTLAFVGLVDYMREIRYRHTGRWTHLPIDYVTGPIAQIIDSPVMAAPVALTALAFGPGGAMASTTLSDILKVARGTEDMSRLLNLFWFWTQTFGGFEQFSQFTKTGDPKHLGNLLMTLGLGEHTALNYEPRRLPKYLPEWMPGMKKSKLVKDAELLRQAFQQMRDIRELRRDIRPPLSIEERLNTFGTK